MKNETPQSYCIKNGIKVYPIHQKSDFYEEGKLIYEKGNWYIEVNNNGKIIKYIKSVGKGNSLPGRNVENAIKKTYQHFVDQIKNQNK